MRTTLTLEPDVSAEIERRRRHRGTSLKQEVNELLRAALRHADADEGAAGPFRTPTLDAGRALIPIDDVDEALRIAEGEGYG
jgi:hypothetical protein